jgi:hypothetical protein
MATYYGTYGQKVQYLASDPSDPQIGQVWYNSTSATLKVRDQLQQLEVGQVGVIWLLQEEEWEVVIQELKQLR